jgi:signal peptidase II
MNTTHGRRVRHTLFLITAILGTAADLLSKYLVFPARMYENYSVALRVKEICPVLGIHCSWNQGAVFGVGQGLGPLFVALSIIAVVLIPFLHFRLIRASGRWQAFGLGAVQAGALGNLYDRLRYGRVRDFIDLHWGTYSWPTFNIADALICVGLAALFISTLQKPQSDDAAPTTQ